MVITDIGAASDFAERALYAFDRCLIPAFNVLSGSSRLDFDRVENRPMFTALHRIISSNKPIFIIKRLLTVFTGILVGAVAG